MSSDSNEGVILRGLRSLLECTRPFPSHMASIRLAILVLLAGASRPTAGGRRTGGLCACGSRCGRPCSPRDHPCSRLQHHAKPKGE